MNDRAELAVLDPASPVRAALQYLADQVEPRWRAADAAARRNQTLHQRLSRIAIAAGSAAIILGIAELATELTFHEATVVPRALGIVAVICAVVAVTIGLVARYGVKWLGQRHRAERLRMLKFRALQQVCCLEPAAWRAWVDAELSALENAGDRQVVEEWSRHERVGADDRFATRAIAFEPPLAALYLAKRLQHQAAYFARRAEEYEQRVGRWKESSLPLFAAGIACVLANFVVEWLHGPKALSIWFVALAAIIPVVGLGVRASFAVFELPRSAALYAAKHAALVRAAAQFVRDAADGAATHRNIAENERFLENEHREWLRLVRHSEWFL